MTIGVDFRWQQQIASGILVILLGALFSLGGWELAHAQNTLPPTSPDAERYTLAKEYYAESCGTCHIPIPPEVLPTETWERILENPGDHYGQRLEPPVGPVILLMWNYLRTFSRSVLEKESVPAFVSKSRYFRALHPQVSFADPVSHRTCYECHPGAQQLNYRQINISAN